MSNKVRGGTPPGTNLCESCKHFKRLTYQNGNSFAQCGAFGSPIMDNYTLRGDVAECNRHEEKNAEELWQLKDKAWIIEVSKSRKMGFISPTERKKKHQEEIDGLE